MLVTGSITTVRHEKVDVDPIAVIEKVKRKWMSSVKIPSDAYIDSTCMWVSWEDTHGSGITERHREATADEVQIYTSFKNVLETTNSILDKLERA